MQLGHVSLVCRFQHRSIVFEKAEHSIIARITRRKKHKYQTVSLTRYGRCCMVSEFPKVIDHMRVATVVPTTYYYGIGPLEDNPMLQHQFSIYEAESRIARSILKIQFEIAASQSPFVAFRAWCDLMLKALAPGRQAFVFQVTLQIPPTSPRGPSRILSKSRAPSLAHHVCRIQSIFVLEDAS